MSVAVPVVLVGTVLSGSISEIVTCVITAGGSARNRSVMRKHNTTTSGTHAFMTIMTEHHHSRTHKRDKQHDKNAIGASAFE